jgi:hypothetical protein
MFEHFTERARRVIFFARWEASKTGCDAISSEVYFKQGDRLILCENEGRLDHS